jgi:hypothetical protein
MTDPIVITKENDGETINFFQESSDESDVQLSRRKQLRRSKPKIGSRSFEKPMAVPKREHPIRGPEPTLNDNMFEVFTNPDKKRLPESESEQGGSDGEPAPPDYYPEDEYEQPDMMDEDYEQPSAGFNTVEDEKQDLLYKFYRLTSKGVPVGKKFTMQSDIREMRSEFNRIQRDSEVKASIRFSRRMLMACVTGIEFLNKRYDPFDVKLDGWSESVMENMDDYDNVFERLHDKYASKVSMAPEIELLLSLAGSAFMFHLTNSMFSTLPNIKDIAKQNPDILKNMMQSMSAAASPSPAAATKEPQNGPREMKPPAIDMSGIFGMMQNMGGPPPNVFPQPQQQQPPVSVSMIPVGNNTFPTSSRTNDVTEVKPPVPPIAPPALKRTFSDSSMSSLSNDIQIPSVSEPRIVSIETSQMSTKKGRGRKNKITSTTENTISI